MIGDTLSYNNLKSIHESMSKIAKIDRSEFFENYFQEVIERMNVHEIAHLKFKNIQCQTILAEPGNGKTN